MHWVSISWLLLNAGNIQASRGRLSINYQNYTRRLWSIPFFPLEQQNLNKREKKSLRDTLRNMSLVKPFSGGHLTV